MTMCKGSLNSMSRARAAIERERGVELGGQGGWDKDETKRRGTYNSFKRLNFIMAIWRWGSSMHSSGTPVSRASSDCL